MKRLLAPLLLLWAGVIVIIYYAVQKPSLMMAFTGLVDTLWTLIVVAILLFNAYGIGRRILRVLKFPTEISSDHLLISFGIGLGALGLLGLFFSVVQLANRTVLTTFQIVLALFFLLRNDASSLRKNIVLLRSELHLAFSQYSFFTKLIVFSLFTLSFLLTLVPPFEAFDALSYHLVQPSRILQDGGLRAVDIPPFWYPSLTQNVYLWSLAMQSERGTQLLHLTWTILGLLVLWRWASQVWNQEIGRKTLLLVSSLSSLPMLASWAYVDMALVYYAIAALYALQAYKNRKTLGWLYVAAIMSGLAMGVKYTSFVVPLACVFAILLNGVGWKSIESAIRFSGLALLIALPWYLRNWLIMHNPFYPFLFNGLYADTFRSQWYANAGTGIGWNAWQIILIPMTMTLGTRELSAAGGHIGPLFLLFLPITLWIFIRDRHPSSATSDSLKIIGVFVMISVLAWTLGVINSAVLWQVRLLYPALILLAIPTALAWDFLNQAGSARIRMWINVVVNLVLVLTVFDVISFTVQRNPLAYALGVQSRMRYVERVNPSYAALIQLMDELPKNAKLYSLYEPRSYALPRLIQPDLVLYNFSDDLFLYKSPDGIIGHWKNAGYTHILVYERGLRLMSEASANYVPATTQQQLQVTRKQLKLVAQTRDKVYSIYEIP